MFTFFCPGFAPQSASQDTPIVCTAPGVQPFRCCYSPEVDPDPTCIVSTCIDDPESHCVLYKLPQSPLFLISSLLASLRDIYAAQCQYSSPERMVLSWSVTSFQVETWMTNRC